MPDMTFSNPEGKSITINSPDGSTPSEGELDQLFSQAHGETQSSEESVSEDVPEKFSDMPNTAVDINSKSTNNFITDIAGDLTRGALNSGAGTVDKINGVSKLLKNITNIDIGSQDLKNVSENLRNIASKQPQSSNSIVSGIGQFVGSVPDAIMEFAGSGGPAGFVARSAALSAADEYNKSKDATSAIKAGVVGGTVGAAINSVPGIVGGSSKILKKWGETAGKTYFQRVTGATNDEAEQFIRDINKIELNPKVEVEDYNDAKGRASEEVSKIRQSNNDLVAQQKEQHTDEYIMAKDAASKSIQDVSRGNDSIVDDLKDDQVQDKINMVRANSDNLIAANEAATQRLANAATEQVGNVASAKAALSNELTSTFSTAMKKLETLQKGVEDNVQMAHASLEKNGLSYVPTSVLQFELDITISKNSKDFFKTITSGDGRSLMVNAKEGVRTPAVTGALDLVNSVRSNLVNEFLKNGKTSLSAIQANQALLETAISKGFKGEALPKDLAEMLSKVKKAINPTGLYEKYHAELSHLKPLADANKAYSTQIDGMRNALDLYKDNVDGTVNPDKVFKALDRGDTSYIAKLKQADEALPREDRIFGKVKNSYDNFKFVEKSEQVNLSRIEKQVSEQRSLLRKKFDDMEQKLTLQQRKEMSDIRTGNSYAERDLSNKQRKALSDMQLQQRQKIATLKAQKDAELATLQQSLNERLKFLHIQAMARGERANPKGITRQVGNMATYRAMNGMMTMNGVDILQGAILNKFSSPRGVSKIVKDAINAPQSVDKIKKVTSNKVLKALLATKSSGR